MDWNCFVVCGISNWYYESAYILGVLSKVTPVVVYTKIYQIIDVIWYIAILLLISK